MEWAKEVGTRSSSKPRPAAAGAACALSAAKKNFLPCLRQRHPKRRRPSAMAISTWKNSWNARGTSSSRYWRTSMQRG